MEGKGVIPKSWHTGADQEGWIRDHEIDSTPHLAGRWGQGVEL